MSRLSQLHKKPSKSSKKLVVFCAALVAVGGYSLSKAEKPRTFNSGISAKPQLPEVLGKRKIVNPRDEQENRVIEYSIDMHLQQTIETTLKKGNVPYGAFVAMDPRTGQVLAMVSHGMNSENLSLRATFPAASIFKIITAAAAIEKGRLQHNSLIPVRGGYHTLYKQNVFRGGGIDPETRPRFARLITFEESFAKSVNSVFGKVGLFGVGSEGLRKVAQRFMFGQAIPFDMPVDQSRATIPDDEFGIAESASGFTRGNTLSPVHGAMIASAIANDGVMMEPSIVSRIITKDGKVEYSFEPKMLGKVIDKDTSDQLSTMMHRTIISGTSRRAFRGISRSNALNEVYIGGKTGTLNGWDPPGRYDWFVGFGERQNSKIAIAALCIHGPRHGIKASQIARKAFESFFGSTIAEQRRGNDKRS